MKTAAETKTNQLDAALVELTKRIELHEYRNRTDSGEWKTKAAETKYDSLQKRLEKLDEEYDAALEAWESETTVPDDFDPNYFWSMPPEWT